MHLRLQVLIKVRGQEASEASLQRKGIGEEVKQGACSNVHRQLHKHVWL